MLENDLNFNPATARVFMRIDVWMRSKNASIARVLPPDYTTIDILTRLDDSIFKQLLKDGTICPTLKRNEISKILRLQRVNADEKRALDLKNFLDRCRRIVGKRLVVLDGQIVTAYHPSKRHLRRLLRNALETDLCE